MFPALALLIGGAAGARPRAACSPGRPLLAALARRRRARAAAAAGAVRQPRSAGGATRGLRAWLAAGCGASLRARARRRLARRGAASVCALGAGAGRRRPGCSRSSALSGHESLSPPIPRIIWPQQVKPELKRRRALLQRRHLRPDAAVLSGRTVTMVAYTDELAIRHRQEPEKFIADVDAISSTPGSASARRWR